MKPKYCTIWKFNPLEPDAAPVVYAKVPTGPDCRDTVVSIMQMLATASCASYYADPMMVTDFLGRLRYAHD